MVDISNSGDNFSENLESSSNDSIISEVSSENVVDVTLPVEETNDSNKTGDVEKIEPDICRICHQVQEDLWLLFGEEMEWNPEPLESLCLCKGTIGLVHRSCLELWLTQTRRFFCELCGFRYETNITPKYTKMQSFWRWTTQARGRGPALLLDVLKLSCLLPTTTGCYCIAFWESYKFLTEVEAIKFFRIPKLETKDYMTVTLDVMKALTFFGATSILMHLSVSTLLSAMDHLEAWYRLWLADYVVKVVVTPPEERASRVVPEDTRFRPPFIY